MIFWIICVAMAGLTVLILALASRRGHAAARPAAEFDLAVYRDQLSEVERDAARGVLAPEDAERLRTEISRRILAADSALQQVETEHRSPTALRIAMVAVIAAALVGGSLYLYRDMGAPGYDDLGLAVRIERIEDARASRPDQKAAEARVPSTPPLENIPQDYAELVAKLRTAVAQRPDDPQGASLLALHERRLGNLVAAYTAQEQVLRIKGSAASSEDFTLYAELLIAAAGGAYVSPQAENALIAAIKKDPKNEFARYYYGLTLADTGRPDLAFRVWSALLRDGTSDPTITASVVAVIDQLAGLAGVDNYKVPEAALALANPSDTSGPSGPTQEQIEDAGEMSAQERAEMIRGMVDQLSERLATEGGPPSDWVRLLNALGVLGDEDGAALVWQDAKETFADAPEALAIIRDAARTLGVTQ